ncbi:globin domain-containing protein [Dyadobacter sp. LJ53]|uniref:globin domain-containing protein n=1 Tax=Dyadobacter chenwenxiniae TaxID=2906456 RepID=UPI001F2BA9C2|nr:globin domain-containing protein [Dyadobacter chenwenxiniae]MCF0050577.1 globin domain-containing protein [Dyadobacter chenwenxiniae]
MNNRDMLIIKNSWSQVIAQPDNPAVLFYENLFAEAPYLISMFHSDLEQQQAKFSAMITYMVMHLQTMPDIQTQIEAMGKRHAKYGVKPEHYALVGKVLINTLETTLGDYWDMETAEAWTNLYDVWASAMLNAAEAG